MVDYMSLEEQVDSDLDCARRKAFLRGLPTGLRRELAYGRSPCFEEVTGLSRLTPK